MFELFQVLSGCMFSLKRETKSMSRGLECHHALFNFKLFVKT